MSEIGYVALLLALVIAAYSGIAAFIGGRKGYPEVLASSRNGAWAVMGLLILASAALLYSFVTHDFSLHYVASYSDRQQPMFYTVAAFWGGQQGSMLLWGLLLSVFTVVVMVQNRTKNQQLLPYVMMVMLLTEAFFLFLMSFVTNPFEKTAVIPPDGQGLNPLLQNPGMIGHPPTLYLGFVGFTVPFAFAMAALITGQLGDTWIRSTRRWTLFAWFFLGAGNILGAQWAYVELGWGGFWGWDPVENASLMPWLVGTAYLHSVMIQQRRGMLKVWNLVLIILTFTLSIFGTFLTRSGVVASVHSFGESSLGPFFLGFIGVVLIASIGLLLDRLPKLKSDNQFDSFLSRESTFLINNLILVGATFAVFWGTVFPLVSEAVRGVKISVNAPFFNQVTGPIFLLMILIMAICPLIGWRRASKENLIRNFLYPFVTAIVLAAILFAIGIQNPLALLSYFLLSFVAFTITLEFIRGTRARHRSTGANHVSALGDLVWKNKPRYGGYIVHLAIILIGVAITGVFFYKYQQDVTMKPGDMVTIQGYSIKYNGLVQSSEPNHDAVGANLEIYQGGKLVDTMVPSKDFYKGQEENPSTEVAVRTTPKEDLYVILSGWDTNQVATISVIINPLILWLWVGGAMTLLGAMVSMWPDAVAERRIALRYARKVAMYEAEA